MLSSSGVRGRPNRSLISKRDCGIKSCTFFDLVLDLCLKRHETLAALLYVTCVIYTGEVMLNLLYLQALLDISTVFGIEFWGRELGR